MAIIEVPRGKDILSFRMSDRWLGEFAQPTSITPSEDARSLIAEALNSQIDCRPLSQLVNPGQKVAIIIDDYTRETPAHLILPLILHQVRQAGINLDDIRIVIALGTHRPMTKTEIRIKVGDEIARRYEIINTSSSMDKELVFLGTSSSGIPAWVNRSVAEADVRIGLGMITPHMDAGFSGGAKIILPGVCGTSTVDSFHSNFIDNHTISFGNVNAPQRRDLEEFVSERVPLDFIVNVIMTLDNKIYRCVAGHPIGAHRVGVAHAREVYCTPIQRKYPIVVANCHPYQQDMWQSTKGLVSGALMTANGGTLILVTQASEGNSTYPLYPSYIGSDPDSLTRELCAGRAEDPKAAVGGIIIGHIKRRINIALVSNGLTARDAGIMGIAFFDTVDAAIENALSKLPEVEREGAVAVLSHAGVLLPQLSQAT